jgi:hypothetical protein
MPGLRRRPAHRMGRGARPVDLYRVRAGMANFVGGPQIILTKWSLITEYTLSKQPMTARR